MDRQRILLLEDDTALENVLCDLFGEEDLDVTLCGSLAALQAAVDQYPRAAVVSDSWERGDYQTLSLKHRAEIVALSRTAEVVLTSGRSWVAHSTTGELGGAQIVLKPFDVDFLMTTIRTALARSYIGTGRR